MKARISFCFMILILFTGIRHATAQGTAFTYQGQLQNNGSPASGIYNLTFSLFGTNTGGSASVGPFTNSAVNVSNGLFTVLIDFGPGVFTGQSNWLEIAVETNGGNSFTTLSPRQQLTPSPYAIYAQNATLLANGTAIGAAQGNAIDPTTSNGFIGGGENNTIGANSPNAAVGGGNNNTIQFNNLNSVIGGGDGNLINHDAGWSAIAGGNNNQISSGWGAITGGGGNTIGNNSAFSTIAGGQNNAIQNNAGNASLGGGSNNLVAGSSATVGGGVQNAAVGNYATVPGGANNTASGQYSFAAGANAQANNDNTFVWSDGSAATASTTSNQFMTRASGGYVLYTASNTANVSVTIGGTITPGDYLTLVANIPGSVDFAESFTYVVATNDTFNSIAAGFANQLESDAALQALGTSATASGATVTITTLSVPTLTFSNLLATATETFDSHLSAYSAGQSVFTNFVSIDGTATPLDTVDINLFILPQLAGGVFQYQATNGDTLASIASNIVAQMETNTSLSGAHVSAKIAFGSEIAITFSNASLQEYQASFTELNAFPYAASESVTFNSESAVGVQLAAGSGSWSMLSDRNAKDRFETVDTRAVLAGVAAMPVTSWNYKSQDKSIRHLGPMAQDFRAAFHLGENENSISMVDEGGVALAAIQGLNQKLDEKDAKINALTGDMKAQETENAELKRELGELKAMVQKLAQQK